MEPFDCLVYALEATAAVPIGDWANSLFYNKLLPLFANETLFEISFLLFSKLASSKSGWLPQLL